MSCVVSACLGEAQVKEASASTDQVARLAPLDPYYSPFSPLGLSGAVSSTNVNVPGKFSYVVNAVHPTQPEVSLFSLISDSSFVIIFRHHFSSFFIRLLRLPWPASPPRLSLMTSPQCLASGSLLSPPIMDTPASMDMDTTGSASA